MSINRLSFYTQSVEGQQMYPFPDGMKVVSRVSVGSLSLNYATTSTDGKKYIVLFPPLEITGVVIWILGR